MQQFLDVGPPDVVKIFVDTREDPEFDNVLKWEGHIEDRIYARHQK